MKEKYYTPELSDLFIGYECEIIYNSDWKQCILDYSYFEHVEFRIDEELIRTPFLTKEQIEVEGWENISERDSNSVTLEKSKIETPEGYIHTRVMKSKDTTHMLVYLAHFYDSRRGGYKEEVLFEGSCPSINEFRKICKLLGI